MVRFTMQHLWQEFLNCKQKVLVRKQLVIILLSVLSTFLLLSCGSKNERKSGQLLYWSSNNTQEIEFAAYIVNEWNKNNRSGNVTFQPVPEGQSSEEIILAAVVGKTTPDLYSNMWQGDVEDYARAGVLVALDTLRGFKDFIYSRCDTAVIKEVTSPDGHIYQIPWKTNPIMLLYNKKTVADLGFKDPPYNYSQFDNASEKFKNENIDSHGYVKKWFGYSEVLVTWWQRFFDFYPLYLAASNGAPLVKDYKAAFDNKYAIQVFAFLKNLYEHNYFAKERLSARQDVFLSNIIATRFTGPWEILHTEKFKPDGFDYGFTHMPVPDDHQGPVYTYGDPKNLVIFKTCSNPQLAWDFIHFMIEKKNDLKLLEITNQLPRRKNLISDPVFKDYFEKNPKMVDFAKQSDYVRGTDPYPNLTEVFDIISQEYEECVIYGKKSPEEAVHEAAKQVNLLYIK
jgi:multiple sugar transport system substrate-binding protein